MRTTQLRSELVMGASLVALCVAMPAIGQAVTSNTVPGAELPPTYEVAVGETYVLGVTTTGSPAATAQTVSVPTGTIVQHLAMGEEEPAPPSLSLAALEAGPELVLENGGSVSILATATATNEDGQAIAHGNVIDAVSQIITAPNTDVSATATNEGTLIVGATALATGTVAPGEGDAMAARAASSVVGGMHQEATVEGGGDGSATVTGTNNELFQAYSNATAAAQGDTIADAVLQEALFMRAQANGGGDGTTLTTLVNNDRLNFSATASSTSSAGNATATSAAGGGEHGLIHVRAATNGVGVDSANAVFNNNAGSSLVVSTNATANAALAASATATGDGAIVMKAQGSGQDDATVATTLTNAGTIAISAGSLATSTTGTGQANATTTLNSAITQITEAGGPESFVGRTGSASITNAATGTISVTGAATATGSQPSFATVEIAPAILQESEMAGVASTSFVNAGTVTVTGTATANYADAIVEGVEHEIFGLGAEGDATSTFGNSGNFTIGAVANASGSSGSLAEAGALGFEVWGEPVNLAITNSNAFTVTSTATSANGPALAGALGLQFAATYDPTVVVEEGEEDHGHGGTEGHSEENGQNGHGGDEEEGPIVWEEEATNALGGTVTNRGNLTVSATATGTSVPMDALTMLDLATNAQALAGGMLFESAVNTVTLTNSGTIRVSAVTNGGYSEAAGIYVRDFAASPIVPGEDDRMTILNNGGTIIARESTDGGAHWTHGTAIDVSNAPNPVDIRFQGASAVYGDIKLGTADTIVIASGQTTLDGVINPFEEMVE